MCSSDLSAHGHAYEITAVVEVESAGTSRGCHLRRLDDAALSTRPVGSERLADASGGPSSPTGTMSAVRSRSDEGEESWSDEYGAHMAVPAPVVLSDGGADDPGDSTEGAAESGDEGGDDESAAVSTDSGESPPAGKKRRGRRRK